MVLIKQKSQEFFNEDFEIKIILNGEFNTFNDYREVFAYFNKFDMIYNHFNNNRLQIESPFMVRHQNTRVVSVSHGSLEIIAFIEKHWFELLLIFIASYKDIKLNTEEAFKDFDRFIDQIEITFREIASDFPQFEKEQIIVFLKWFNSLTKENQDYLIRHIKSGERVFRRIRRVLIRR